MLQLCGHEPIHAMAHRNLGGNRPRERLVLLVSDETFPSGRRRLPLGAASRSSFARWAKSLRYAVRAIPADGGAFRSSLRASRTGSRGGTLLGDQLFPAGFRSYPQRLCETADLFRLSVLERNPHGAMGTDHRCQRILPAAAALDHGQTSDRIAGLPNATQPPRRGWVCRHRDREPGGDADMAVAYG